MKGDVMRLQRYRGLVLVTATIGLVAGGAAVATTSAGAATAGCQVSYTISSQWQGGFGANVSVTNLGDPINGWTLTWSFAPGQSVTQAWNAGVTQSGTSVSATDVGYNGALGTRASASFGFNGAWSGSNPVPASFRLDKSCCAPAPSARPRAPHPPGRRRRHRRPAPPPRPATLARRARRRCGCSG